MAGRRTARRPAAHAARAAAVLLAAAAATPAAAAPQAFTLDPGRTFVHFEVLHFGTATLAGRFAAPAGEVVLDRAQRRGRVALTIATASVSTGLPLLDRRLREPDLLAVDAHPQAWFVADRLRFDDAGGLVEVRGEFTLRGVGVPLSLHARRFGCRDEAAEQVCGGDFEGELLRSAFGADFGLPFVADRVRLVVQVEGRTPLLRDTQN